MAIRSKIVPGEHFLSTKDISVDSRPFGTLHKAYTREDLLHISYNDWINCTKNLSSWQLEIYNDIINHKDVFISVAPAGGKTRPVVCAYKK